MKITALVENESNCELKAKHGLSLYIETPKYKILFDVGPDNTLFANSRMRGIDLSEIDIVILSHGHMDHGGTLEQFLKVNHTAKVYAQRKAFEKHYSKLLFFKVNVGVDPSLQIHPQVILLDGDYKIDDELMLFTVPNTERYYSSANDVLYTDTGKDNFSHEQNLMVLGDANVLITGCGHAGVVNILEKAAKHRPQVCVGGYHLFNPLTRKTVSSDLLEGIAQELKKYDIRYYTCHCTGQKAYRYLSERLANMHYLSCGETIKI